MIRSLYSSFDLLIQLTPNVCASHIHIRLVMIICIIISILKINYKTNRNWPLLPCYTLCSVSIAVTLVHSLWHPLISTLLKRKILYCLFGHCSYSLLIIFIRCFESKWTNDLYGLASHTLSHHCHHCHWIFFFFYDDLEWEIKWIVYECVLRIHYTVSIHTVKMLLNSRHHLKFGLDRCITIAFSLFFFCTLARSMPLSMHLIIKIN